MTLSTVWVKTRYVHQFHSVLTNTRGGVAVLVSCGQRDEEHFSMSLLVLRLDESKMFQYNCGIKHTWRLCLHIELQLANFTDM